MRNLSERAGEEGNGLDREFAPIFLGARIVYPTSQVWITNGKVAWRIPDRTFAAWLTEGVIMCPEGWRVVPVIPEGFFDEVMGADLVHCIREAEWKKLD